MKAKFTGHDTFPLRYGWLNKAVNHLKNGGKLQTSKDLETQDAIISLGVGKNMVNAIRYWAESVQLLSAMRVQSSYEYEVSEFGTYLFDNSFGKDPYLENSGSVWLIHFWLNYGSEELSAYKYFFNFFNGEYFEKEVLLSHLSDDLASLVGNSSKVTKSTLQKDIDAFLNTYTKKAAKKAKSGEEQFNSPLAELGLIKDGGRGYFLSELTEQNDLPVEIFIYALMEFVKKSYVNSKVSKVNFNSLLVDPYSPGRIFRLSEKGLAQKLDEAQVYSGQKIKWLDSQGLRQVEVEEKLLSDNALQFVFLDKYYEVLETL